MLSKSIAAFAAVVSFALLPASHVSAADLWSPNSTSLKDSPGETAFSWTGVNIGVQGGYLWGNSDYPGLPNYPDGPPNPDVEGAFVGGQIGYSRQFDGIVLGIESDVSATNIEDTVRDGNYITQTTSLDWFGTVRGKIGLARGNFQPYVTAGFAWADVSYNETCPSGAQFGFCRPAAAGPYSKSDNDTLTGWTVGGGLKYAVSEHVIVGAEYLHLDFGSGHFDLGTSGTAQKISDKDLAITADVAKFTVDYKF